MLDFRKLMSTGSPHYFDSVDLSFQIIVLQVKKIWNRRIFYREDYCNNK